MSNEVSPGTPDEPGSGGRLPLVPEHRLIRCVGSGSSGQVWLAQSILGGFRAVKLVYRSRFRDERPFEREFVGVQRFEPISRENEGFVDILQVGRADDGGYFYYVMELADDARGASTEGQGDLEGYVPRTLSRVLADKGRLSLDACIDLGLALCQALARLHAAGLIHRDVKPSNVIFVGGKPRLADIGLVVERGEALSWVGTEGFIPPEGPNSPQSDLFSLGKLLYAAATGLDRADFPRLPLGVGSEADGARFLELNAILLKACAASVQARYQTAGEMESDLLLLKSGGSVRRRRRGGWVKLAPGRSAPFLAGTALMLVGLVWLGGIPGRKNSPSGAPTAPGADQGRSLSKGWAAEGVLRMAAEDESAALLFFTEALAAARSAGEPTEVHRLRIGSVRKLIPNLLCELNPGGDVFSADLSLDGKLLATANREGAVTIWDAVSGVRMSGPYSSNGVPMQVRITPDGKRLLLVPQNRFPALQGMNKATGSARVLDLATGQPAVPQIDGVMWGTFSPDGRRVATIGAWNEMELHSLDRPQVSFKLKGHQHAVSWMAFSPDGSAVASVSTDGTARLWRTSDGTALGEPLSMDGAGMMVDFSPDGRRLATLAKSSKSVSMLNVWELGTTPKKLTSDAVTDGYFALDFGVAGGRRLLTGHEKGSLTLRSFEGTALASEVLRAGKGKCVSWGVSADGTHVAIGTEDGAVRVRSAEDGSPLSPVMRHAAAVRQMAMNRDGTRLMTLSGPGSLRIWEIGSAQSEWEALRLPGTLPTHDAPYFPYPVALMAGGKQVVFSMLRTGRKVPVCLDVASGREVPLPESARDPECAAVMTGRRKPIVAFHADSNPFEPNAVVLLRQSAGSWTRTELPHPFGVDQMAFSDDDQILWTLDFGRCLYAWNVLNGSRISRHPLPQSEVLGPSISPDGWQCSWFNQAGTELFVEDLHPASAPRRRVPLPASLMSAEHYLRSFYLSRITADWPSRDWKQEPVARLPFPAAELEGYRIAALDPDRQRVLAFKREGAIKVVDLKQRSEVGLTSESGNTPLAEVSFDTTGRYVTALDVQGSVSVFESRRGEVVGTRPNDARGAQVYWSLMTEDGILLTAEAPNRILRWSIRSAENSVEQLREEAVRASGRRLNAQGGLVWRAP